MNITKQLTEMALNHKDEIFQRTSAVVLYSRLCRTSLEKDFYVKVGRHVQKIMAVHIKRLPEKGHIGPCALCPARSSIMMN
jgi:hypothetical protein